MRYFSCRSIAVTQRLRQALAGLLLGLAVASAWAVPAGNPASAAPAAASAGSPLISDTLKTNLTKYVTQTYRVPRSRTETIIDVAMEVGKRNNLDPLLILSVTAAESAFQPDIRNKVSGASGLMQVMPKVHSKRLQKFGGQVFDIRTNMLVGGELLREMINMTGSLSRGLKYYVGAALMSGDTGYGNRISREHSRLRLAAEGDVLQAVKLHRQKRPAGTLKDISGTFTEFQKWASATDDK